MITPEQRQLRRQFLGSSDAAAILGLDPYRSAADVWLSKVHQIDDATSEAADAGNLLEGAVLDWAERELGRTFIRDIFFSDRKRRLGANLDGYIGKAGNAEIVEAKTTGITGPADEAYDAEPPERVIVQVHHQMAVLGPDVRVAWVPVLIGGQGFRMYRVDRNDELAQAIQDRGAEFMADYVVANRQPDDFKPSLEILKRVRREPNKIVTLDDAVVDRFIVARAAAKQAADDKEEAEAALLAALGDAEGGDYGGGRVTYLSQQRRGYTVEPSECRVLRIKAAKQLAIAGGQL